MTDPLFLHLRRIGFIRPWMFITITVALFVTTAAIALMEFESAGMMWGYPFSITILFVAFYEEALFRGAILGLLVKYTNIIQAVTVSSLLFGLWHAKNLFWLEPTIVVHQMVYTGVIVGPILAVVTIKTRTIWPAIILHQLNNIVASPIILDILRP